MLLRRIFEGLRKTREKVTQILGLGPSEANWEEIEEALILADVGVETAQKVIERAKERAKREGLGAEDAVRREIVEILEGAGERSLNIVKGRLNVILFVGVNGTGKTTTIAKFAKMLKGDGFSPVLAAGDTFRAAGIEQLVEWGRRIGAPVIKHREGADPAAVIYDAISFARSRGHDVVLADTAGRLHVKKNLMEELKKVRRVAAKACEGAPHEVLLVLDAVIGQNNIRQAEAFLEAVNVTGIVVAKLDGSAKGGAIIPIVEKLKIPVKFVGVGEREDDLVAFDPKEFAEGIIPHE